MLRDYQARLIDETMWAFASHSSVLLQLPTGGGKTHIASSIVRSASSAGKRIWFVSHRHEIVSQTSASLDAMAVPHGFIARERDHSGDLVSVCSIDTLRRRLDREIAPDIVIWDECHHLPARSWSTVKDKLVGAKHLGLTATPTRLDGAGLAHFFDTLIVGPDTRRLIEAGHLSRYRIFAPTIPDLRGVSVRSGDYAKEQLAERMDRPAIVGDVVEHYRRLTPNARAIVFAVSVKASRTIVDRFLSVGVPAAHVDGRTPRAEREAAVAALAAGAVKVLSNVEVFTEGFDLPAIDAVILMRPTKSFALWRQMVGRGLRTAPGKSETIILDHAGLVHEHGLPDDEVEWSLDGYRLGQGQGKGVGSGLRRCPSCLAVHPPAPFCTSCGYAYDPQDRTLDEIYGDLSEIAQPEGYETVRQFAHRVGMDPSNLRRMFARGLPREPNGLLETERALAWFSSRRTNSTRAPVGSQPGQFEKRADFARRVGLSKAGVNKRCEKGMPCGPNGWVNVVAAIEWLQYRDALRVSREKVRPAGKPRPKGESTAVFAQRHNLPTSVIANLIKRGMPRFDDGSVDSSAAEEWLKTATLGRFKVISGYEPKKTFAKRVGVSGTGGLRGLLRRGLPVEKNGLVNIERGLDFVERDRVAKAS